MRIRLRQLVLLYSELVVMGVNWISWTSAVTVIITLLHIQGVVSITTMTVTVVEGQTLSFRCNYTRDSQKSTSSTYFLKYFYRVDNKVSNNLIVSKAPNKLWENGRFSLYDNSAEACVIVRVDKASPEDSGTYWCGVDVSAHPDDITVVQLTVVPADSPDILWQSTTVQMIPTAVIQVSNPLFLTAVMCVAAMLFVCVFTLGLMLTVKHRGSALSHDRQTSADYETMMPSVQNQPELCCACPDCVELSAFSSPPPNCANFRSKQRESAMSMGINDYAVVNVLEHSCQYQCLDVNQEEEKVYQDLHRNRGDKDERAV